MKPVTELRSKSGKAWMLACEIAMLQKIQLPKKLVVALAEGMRYHAALKSQNIRRTSKMHSALIVGLSR